MSIFFPVIPLASQVGLRQERLSQLENRKMRDKQPKLYKGGNCLNNTLMQFSAWPTQTSV